MFTYCNGHDICLYANALALNWHEPFERVPSSSSSYAVFLHSVVMYHTASSYPCIYFWYFYIRLLSLSLFYFNNCIRLCVPVFHCTSAFFLYNSDFIRLTCNANASRFGANVCVYIVRMYVCKYSSVVLLLLNGAALSLSFSFYTKATFFPQLKINDYFFQLQFSYALIYTHSHTKKKRNTYIYLRIILYTARKKRKQKKFLCCGVNTECSREEL